jgi:hypothetical protein
MMDTSCYAFPLLKTLPISFTLANLNIQLGNIYEAHTSVLLSANPLFTVLSSLFKTQKSNLDTHFLLPALCLYSARHLVFSLVSDFLRFPLYPP